MATSSLSKITPAWSDFYNKNKDSNLKCICLLGTQNSGKSTLCELFNAYVANNKHKDLQFDDGKVKQYSLAGIISANSLKIQTVKPSVYAINAQVDNLPNLTIIDTPTYSLPPFNQSNKKLWTFIDSKVSFNYFIKTAAQCSFVFVIDQKFTRVPMDGTKSILINFIDSLKQYPKQIFDSTALIISKCPAGFKLQTCITRIEGCIKKIDDPNVKYIDEWFQNIKQRSAILVFNKFATEEDVKKQVKGIYKQLSKLVPYPIQPEKFKTFEDMKPELKDELRKYLDSLSQGFGGLVNIILEIPESLIKNGQQFENHKNQLAVNLFGASSQKPNKIEAELPTIFDVLLTCFSVYKLASSKIDENFFLNLLANFVKYGVITETEDLYLGLKQRADFFKTFWVKDQKLAGWNEEDGAKQLQQKAFKIKDYKVITQALKDSFEEGKQVDYYENLISLIEFLVPAKELEGHEFLGLWINCNLEIAAKLSKPKSLKRFLQLESKLTAWKKFDLVSNLLSKIAEVLISVNCVGFAVSFYNKCGNPYKGIQEMSKILNDKDIKKKFSMKDFVPYLQLLQDIGLFEKSYETCYFLRSIFQSEQDRTLLKPFLLKSPSAPKKETLESFLEGKVRGLEQAQVARLKQLAEELEKKNFS